MHAPLFFLPQMMHCRSNLFVSILLMRTGVFGVTEGPGIHIAQERCTHSYKVSVGTVSGLSNRYSFRCRKKV